ncbi:MAG: iron-containing alcohol dehydrogenase, partial [Endomicrobia bacterium]|nr:iron-containing alcohol dehydrogenase [Endomicrobiia bacterium]
MDIKEKHSYKFFLPTRIIFGPAAITSVVEEIKIYGKKILVVCGKSALKSRGVLDNILEMFTHSRIEFVVYNNVKQEPDTQNVVSALMVIKSESCDCVLGIGGGSVIDVAKASAGLYGEFINNTDN